jgi:hypothetical protein
VIFYRAGEAKSSYSHGRIHKPDNFGLAVPRELKSKAEFDKLVGEATEVRVIHHGDQAKVKLRTRDALYTFKTTSAEADTLTKGVKAELVEY